MIKILIVNDKYGIAEKVGEKIAGTIQEDFNVEVLPGIEAAKNWLELHPEPDIILMDVHMRNGVSFDLFKYLKIDCPIIFTTEHEYAACVYKMRAGNQVQKVAADVAEEPLPLVSADFAEHNLKHCPAQNLSRVIAGLKEKSAPLPPYKEKFIVNVRNNWIPVDIKEIACFMRKHLNYLYTFSGEKYMLDYGTLEDIEKLLDPKMFYRTNRQTIVNINAIGIMRPLGNQKITVVLKEPLKIEVDVSREKAPVFKRWFDR